MSLQKRVLINANVDADVKRIVRVYAELRGWEISERDAFAAWVLYSNKEECDMCYDSTPTYNSFYRLFDKDEDILDALDGVFYAV